MINPINTLITKKDFENLTETEALLLTQFIRNENRSIQIQSKKNASKEEEVFYLKNEISKSLDEFNSSDSGHKIFNRILASKSIIDIVTTLFPKYVDVIKQGLLLDFEAFEGKYKVSRLAGITHKDCIDRELGNLDHLEYVEHLRLFKQLSTLSLKDLSENLETVVTLLYKPSIETEKLPLGLSLESIKDLEKSNQNVSQQFLIHKIFEGLKVDLANFIKKHALSFIKAHFFPEYREKIVNYSKNTIEVGDEFTLNRQVLALNILMDKIGVNNIDNTVKAKFYQFLTRRNLGNKRIETTELYKKMTQSHFKKNDQEYVQSFFNSLGIDN